MQHYNRNAPPSKEAIDAVLTVASPKLRLILQLASSLGLQASELTTLRYRDIDWTSATLLIMPDDDQQPRAQRTAIRSKRRISIGPGLLAVLEEHRRSSTYRKDHDFLVPNEHGRKLHPSLISRSLSEVFARLGWSDDTANSTPETQRFTYYGVRRHAVYLQSALE